MKTKKNRQLSRLCRTASSLIRQLPDELIQFYSHRRRRFRRTIRRHLFNRELLEQIALMRKAEEYMNAHWREDVSITDVARYVGLKLSRFSELFFDITGCLCSKYLVELRLRCAKNLLKNPVPSISQVAEQSGFQTHGRLRKTFISHTGITPAHFRHEHRMRRAA